MLLQAVEGFANLEATLPPGCTTIKFAKVAEAVVFLDDDAQLDMVVDEAEMEAAALDVRFFSVTTSHNLPHGALLHDKYANVMILADVMTTFADVMTTFADVMTTFADVTRTRGRSRRSSCRAS